MNKSMESDAPNMSPIARAILRLRSFARPIAIGVLAFLTSVLAACSFEQVTIFHLPTEFFALALTVGILALFASYFFLSSAVIASLTVSFLLTYLVHRYQTQAAHALTIPCFISCAIGLLIQQRRILISIIFALGLPVAFFLSHTSGAVLLTGIVIVFIGFAASYLSASTITRSASDLGPSFVDFAIVRRQVAAFLGMYVVLAIVFAVIYHNLYLLNSNSFRIVSGFNPADVTTGYFVYWSFNAFTGSGLTELSPATTLVRAIVAIQKLLGISWLTIFFAIFVQRLKNTQTPRSK